MRTRLLALFILATLPPANAAIYKCLQDNGAVLYSDTPCNNKDSDTPVTIQESVVNEKAWWEQLEDAITSMVSSDEESEPGPRSQTNPDYHCAGKIYCSQMRSCNEAMFYLENCPGVRIDGNHDGIPCERQWCN